jgi:nicotinate phosphoribosyltransferase
MARDFHAADDEEIRRGDTTDVYFSRTRRILEAKGRADVPVAAEFTVGSLPDGWPWAVFAGLEELVELLEDRPVDLWAAPEGTLFRPRTRGGVRTPVAVLEGPYGRFCRMETPGLGLLCQSSGVATRAARVRLAAGDTPVLSFGIRRMHPAVAPAVDRACYVGGVDGVSCELSAERMGLEPQGTMPHALIITVGDQRRAWEAFDEVLTGDVPRTALVDTYVDEKGESLAAAEALGEALDGVRLDTPGSRRGNMAEIVEEVRWELDLRGREDVQIFVSGGLDEHSIPPLKEAGAEGFGVGTSLSDAPTVNYAMDVVERDGDPCAKRGKFGGRKALLRCRDCFVDRAVPWSDRDDETTCPACGGTMEPVLRRYLEDGDRVRDLPGVEALRDRVLDQLDRYDLERPEAED